MAKLRLFANLREIAGTSRLEVPATTVGEAIESITTTYGSEFSRGVESSRIWVNGDPADMSASVTETDEIVILPPVSGGSQPATLATTDFMAFLPLGIAVIAILANLQSQPIWAAAIVAIGALWAIDMNSAFVSRGRVFAPLAVVTVVAAATISAHILGPTGYGLSVAISVAVVLGWAVAFAEYRQIEVFAPVLLVALIGGLAAASMVLARSSFTPDASSIDVFLVATIAGVALGALVGRLPAVPFLDRFSTTAIGAVLGAVVAAMIWDLDLVGYLLVGLGISVALVAGQGLSSMLRTGSVALTERPPGVLASLDGVVLAAAIYFPLIRLVI